MGKMKELFMKIHYPQGDYDLEREYLIDNSLKESRDYEEYLTLIRDQEIQSDKTKIEVNGTTRIEVHKENKTSTKEFEI